MGVQSSGDLHVWSISLPPLPKIMLTYAILFLCVGLSASQTARQSVKAKSVCDDDAGNCLSGPQSFKCSMAFKNLTKSDGSDIKILDIIPDLIDQPGVDLTQEIIDELEEREINFEAFDINDVCPGSDVTGKDRLDKIALAKKRANARCYAFLNDYTEEELDSCDKGLVTKDGKALVTEDGEKIDEGTVGDTICERAYKLAKDHEDTNKFWFKALVEIGAYVSYCGSTWQEVATGGKHLTLKKKLCCIKKPGEPVKYRPCNGSKKFNQECKLTK